MTAARVIGGVSDAQLLDDEAGLAGDEEVAVHATVNRKPVSQPEYLWSYSPVTLCNINCNVYCSAVDSDTG